MAGPIKSANPEPNPDPMFGTQRPGTLGPGLPTGETWPSGTDTARSAQDHAEAAMAAARQAGTSAVGAAREVGGHASHAVREAGQSAAEALDALAIAGRDRLGQGLETLSANVSRHPIAAIAIAGGVGILLGLMSRPERR